MITEMISAPTNKGSLKIDLSTLTQLTKRPTGYVNHTRDSYQLKCLKCSFFLGGGGWLQLCMLQSKSCKVLKKHLAYFIVIYYDDYLECGY